MRIALVSLSLAVALALGGCGSPGDAQNDPDEIAALKKRVAKLEKRVRQLETRGKKRAKPPAKGKAPNQPAAPMRQIALEGDAKSVVLGANKKRFKVPGKVPPGTYNVFVSFTDDPPAKKGQVVVPKGKGAVTVECTRAKDGCAIKAAGGSP